MLSQSIVNISLENGDEIAGTSIVHKTATNTLAERCTLHFTSLVDVSRVPLCLIAGPPFDVTTTNLASQEWFSQHLLCNPSCSEGEQPWWQKAGSESPIGILASVQTSSNGPALPPPKPSDILFYAAARSDLVPRPPTPPSSSPATDSLITTDQDLSSAFRTRHLTHRKRRTVNDTFEDAAERRQKARRTGGSSIAAAAAVKTDTAGSYPTFSHRRSVSGSSNHAVPAPNRSASRGSSVASSRPTTARAASEVPKRSSLARVESATGTDVEDTTEIRNKDLISRVVMAGMRLHGLSQSKRKKAKGSTIAAQSFEQGETDRRNDEEFKLVYHQVYKGTQFAFRQHIEQSTLQPHADALREVVDRLLILFCTNPLENGRTGLADKLTPGGRKTFESASAAEAHTSPFASAPIVQTNRMFRYWIFESYLVICASKSKSPHLAPITWRRPTVKIRSCLSPTSRCKQRQGRPESDQYTMHHIMNGCILTTGRVQHLAVKPVAAHSDLTSAAVAGSKSVPLTSRAFQVDDAFDRCLTALRAVDARAMVGRESASTFEVLWQCFLTKFRLDGFQGSSLGWQQRALQKQWREESIA
ncbi:hypothetical protein KC367_g229 [Hortaea werneckii]|nr:hypothetical protein KC367_g229 [Hortaea werneckii]